MKPSDLDAVMSLDAVCLPAPWSAAVWRSEMSSPIGLHLVCESKGRIIAQIGCKKILDELHITTICVDPGYRRRGLARTLVDEAARRAGNTCRVTLEVRSKNESARNFYTKLGFSEDGVRPRYYGDDDAVVMSLVLR